MATSNTISDEATEKGITTIESTDIECIMDPLLNIKPDEQDLIAFNTGLHQYGIYRIIDIDTGSTLFRPYYKIKLRMIPNISIDKMKNFVIGEKAFLTNYHYVFEKGDAQLIIKLQMIIEKYIDYFNNIYNHQIDAHVDNDNRVFLDFDKAFNQLIEKYNGHTFTATIHKSYLCDNLLSKYSDINPFRIMMNMIPNGNDSIDLKSYDFTNFNYTSKISRLDKSRRRSLNNRIKVYRLATDKTTGTLHPLELPIKEIKFWQVILKDEDFINNVKDSLIRFIDEDCTLNPTNMFLNSVRLAQLFYILDDFIKNKMVNLTNYFTTVNI